MKEPNGVRILWHANAPWARTGYGTQSNSLLPRLVRLPEVDDIGLLAYYGIQGGVSDQEIGKEMPVEHVMMRCYPPRMDPWGNDVVMDHTYDFDADVVVTLFDLWPLAPDFGWRGARWAPWAPVDHEPIPPAILERATLSPYDLLVYSQSAAEEYKRHGVPHTYIPHGVETTLYAPGDEETRRAAKRMLSFPEDCFLVGTVGANKGWPPRKGWAEMYEALSIFKRRAPNPDKIMFYQHSLCTGEHGGPDLIQMTTDFGVNEWTRFGNPYKLASSGMTTEEMVAIYQAMDVFILLSRGEGFGLPIIESQSCGTPVIVTDWTACRELGQAGYRIPARREWTPQRSWWGRADPVAAADALLDVYGRWTSERASGGTPYTELREAARRFALPYDWQQLVDEHWHPWIQRLWAELQPRTWMPLARDLVAAPALTEEPSYADDVAALEEAHRSTNGNHTLKIVRPREEVEV